MTTALIVLAVAGWWALGVKGLIYVWREDLDVTFGDLLMFGAFFWVVGPFMGAWHWLAQGIPWDNERVIFPQRREEKS